MRATILPMCLVLLAACSSEQGAPAPAPVAAETDAAAVVPTQDAGFDYSPLPSGVVVETPYIVRSERVYLARNGAERHLSTIELLEGDAIALASEIGGRLAADGYRTLKVADRGDGITRQAFNKRGAGRVNLSATQEVGERPAHPRSVGLISIDWQSAPAPRGSDAEGAAPDADDAGTGPEAG